MQRSGLMKRNYWRNCYLVYASIRT